MSFDYQKNNVEENVQELLELPIEYVEKIVLKQLLNPQNFDNHVFITQYFKLDFFKNDNLKKIFQIALNFNVKYKSIITKDLLYKILEKDQFNDTRAIYTEIIDEVYNIDETKYSEKYITDTLIEFTRGRAIYAAVLDNITDIEEGNGVGNCLKRFEEIMKIGISDDLGIEYFENIEQHIHDLTEREARIPFNWKEWDKFTYGGIPVNDPCLFVIMGQPGLGKSQAMMNIGAQYILQNKRVLMISLEMSEKMYSRRMSALFSNIDVNMLKDQTGDLKKRVESLKMGLPKAQLRIKQYSPNEFNSIKLKALLQKLKDLKNFVPDLIIVDYLNIMSTNSSSSGLKSYERVGTISKELRSVSIETKIPILTGTQANRSGSTGGYAGEDISMNNTSDSAGINMDADAIFALFQLEGERELGRINVKILKNRLGGFVGAIFPMMVDYSTLKFTDWNVEEEELYENTLDVDNLKVSSTDEDDEDFFSELGV